MAFGHQPQCKDERAIFETAYYLLSKERKASLSGNHAGQASSNSMTPGVVSNAYNRFSD